MFNENNVVEILQFVACILAFFWFLYIARREISGGFNDAFSVTLFISQFAFVGGGREISFGAIFGLGGTPLLIAKIICSFFFALSISISLLYAMQAIRTGNFKLKRAFVGVPLLLLGLLLIGVGQLAERGQLGIPHSLALEEISELFGYSLFLASALVRNRSRNQQ